MTDRYGPFPGALVSSIASQHGVPADTVGSALQRIHDDLHEGGDAIHAYYIGSNSDAPSYGETTGEASLPEPTTADAGLVTVLFVESAEWTRLTDRFELSDDGAAAVEAVHAAYAEEVAAVPAVADGSAARGGRDGDADLQPLVLPSPRVAALARAGLSRQQAAVQVLREQGATQASIAERLGLGVGTVKSHCYRVDEKVREARALLDVLDEVGDDEQ